MQLITILFVICFFIVDILSLAYFLHICNNFLKRRIVKVGEKCQQRQIFGYGGSMSQQYFPFTDNQPTELTTLIICGMFDTIGSVHYWVLSIGATSKVRSGCHDTTTYD
jgi:hypothetical protein